MPRPSLVRLALPLALALLASISPPASHAVIADETAAALLAPLPLRLQSTQTFDATRTDVNWTWGDANPDETGFLVEVKEGADGAWGRIPQAFAPLAPGVRTVIGFRLTTGETYYFRVQAFRGDNPNREFSPFSGELTVIAGTTQPPPPTGKRPDLSASVPSITATPVTRKGQQMVLLKGEFTIKNVGQKNAKKSHVGLYLSEDAVLQDAERVRPLFRIGISPLYVKALPSAHPPRKKSIKKSFTYLITRELYERFRGRFLIIAADWDNKVVEKDETTNNVQSVLIPAIP